MRRGFLIGVVLLASFNISARGETTSDDGDIKERMRSSRNSEEVAAGKGAHRQDKAVKLSLSSKPDPSAAKIDVDRRKDSQENGDSRLSSGASKQAEPKRTLEEELSIARQDMAKKNWLSARRHFIFAYQLAPDRVDFIPELSEACLRCNDPNGAILVLEKLTQSPVGQTGTYYERLGEALLSVNNTEKAAEAFRNALKYGASDLDAQKQKNIHRRLLQLAVRNKDKELEKQECEEMMKIAPEDSDAQAAFVRVLLNANRDEVEPLLLEFESPLSKPVLSEVERTVFIAASKNKNLELVEKQHQVSIKLSPKDDRLKIAYADFLTGNGRDKEAEKVMSTVNKTSVARQKSKTDLVPKHNPRLCFLNAMQCILKVGSIEKMEHFLTQNCQKRLAWSKKNVRDVQLMRSLRLSARGRIVSLKNLGSKVEVLTCNESEQNNPVYTNFTMALEDDYWKIDDFKSGRVIHHVLK